MGLFINMKMNKKTTAAFFVGIVMVAFAIYLRSKGETVVIEDGVQRKGNKYTGWIAFLIVIGIAMSTISGIMLYTGKY